MEPGLRPSSRPMTMVTKGRPTSLTRTFQRVKGISIESAPGVLHATSSATAQTDAPPSVAGSLAMGTAFSDVSLDPGWRGRFRCRRRGGLPHRQGCQEINCGDALEKLKPQTRK